MGIMILAFLLSKTYPHHQLWCGLPICQPCGSVPFLMHNWGGILLVIDQAGFRILGSYT